MVFKEETITCHCVISFVALSEMVLFTRKGLVARPLYTVKSLKCVVLIINGFFQVGDPKVMY